MRGEQDESQLKRRLLELARRCDAVGVAAFSGFLTPPEAEWALWAARSAGVQAELNGGYEDAERRMACFFIDEAEPFPIMALELRWPHQDAPAHRDILGSVMGLGLDRSRVGDIVVEKEQAYLFTETRMADYLQQNLLSAGRVRLQIGSLDQLPVIGSPEGKEVRDTVASLRLDAVVSAGFNISRAKAAALIAAGQVKLRHLPNEHVDAQVSESDAISVRGLGRLKVQTVGSLTRKERYPLLMLRYGDKQ